MIESIQFKNFKALRDATLPLGPCTILVGPNGSGKSTVLQALQAVKGPGRSPFRQVATADMREDHDAAVEVCLSFAPPFENASCIGAWQAGGSMEKRFVGCSAGSKDQQLLDRAVTGIRVFSFDATAMANAVKLRENMQLSSNGNSLAGVLDRLRDHTPERFEALNEELGRWLPEFDRILFDIVNNDQRVFLLRTRDGHHEIAAADLSQGTLIALAILTLAYLPNPPSLIGLEEPDRGIHPYLLRHVQDAIYRLTNPEGCGETREPVQVIATTHSPYFVDLFKDFPEEIVVANKVGADVQFQRLTDQPHFKEILGDAALGEAWYTGVLGGVPSRS